MICSGYYVVKPALQDLGLFLKGWTCIVRIDMIVMPKFL